MVASASQSVWDIVIDPAFAQMDLASAKMIASVEFPTSAVDRMNELAEKAQDGTLSVPERAQMEEYMQVGRMLAILQSKARQLIDRHSNVSEGR